jgi:hypothetical protein
MCGQRRRRRPAEPLALLARLRETSLDALAQDLALELCEHGLSLVSRIHFAP